MAERPIMAAVAERNPLSAARNINCSCYARFSYLFTSMILHYHFLKETIFFSIEIRLLLLTKEAMVRSFSVSAFYRFPLRNVFPSIVDSDRGICYVYPNGCRERNF